MKRHLSIWKLLIRSTVFRLALCLGAMCVAESGVFLWRAGSAATFEDAVGNGPAYAIFVAAYYCLFIILETTFRLPNQLYALERLRISERNFLLWQAFHNTLCFMTLWGAEVTIIFILSLWYRGAHPENAVSPWLLLAFYRNSFLRGLLPPPTVSRWIANPVYFTGSGILSACAALKHRHELRVIVPHAFMILESVTFRVELSDPAEDMARIFFALCMISLSFVNTFEAGHPGVKLEAKINVVCYSAEVLEIRRRLWYADGKPVWDRRRDNERHGVKSRRCCGSAFGGRFGLETGGGVATLAFRTLAGRDEKNRRVSALQPLRDALSL